MLSRCFAALDRSVIHNTYDGTGLCVDGVERKAHLGAKPFAADRMLQALGQRRDIKEITSANRIENIAYGVEACCQKEFKKHGLQAARTQQRVLAQQPTEEPSFADSSVKIA